MAQCQRVKFNQIRTTFHPSFPKHINRVRRVHAHIIDRDKSTITGFFIKRIILNISLCILVLQFNLINILVPLIGEENQFIFQEVRFHNSSRECQHNLMFSRVRTSIGGFHQRLVTRKIYGTHVETVSPICQIFQLVRLGRTGK